MSLQYELLLALNSAAEALQKAVSDDEIVRGFCKEIVRLDLCGSVLLLTPDRERLTIVAMVFPRFERILASRPDTAGLSRAGRQVELEQFEVLKMAIELKSARFIPDTRSMLGNFLPRDIDAEVRDLIGQLPTYSGICAPLHSNRKLTGVCVLAGERLTENDLPAVVALANHMSIARDNARILRQVRRSEANFRTLFESQPDSVMLVDSEYRIKLINRAQAGIDESSVGKLLLDVLPPALGHTYHSLLQRVLNTGETQRAELEFEQSSGARVWLDVMVAPIQDNGVVAAIAQSRDVTDQHQLLAALENSESKYRSLVDNAPVGVYRTNLDGTILYCNDALASMLGSGNRDELIRSSSTRLYRDQTQRLRLLDDLRRGDVRGRELALRRLNGEPIDVLCSGTLEFEGSTLTGMLVDISERKRLEKQLLANALRDRLTGLGNRAMFVNELQTALTRAQLNPDYLFAVLLLDLDHFKLVNDSYGHDVGDRLIIACSERLQSCVRASDILSRIGGDEFAVLLDGVEPKTTVERMSKTIEQAFGTPFVIEGFEVFVTLSIGVAYPRASTTRPGDLLREADTALHRAKDKGRAQHIVFDRKMLSRMVSRLQMATDLRRALLADQFEVHYQPIVTLSDGVPIGFEALLRWQHPERGWVSPAEFIPIAEETSLIVELERRVIRASTRALRRWKERFSGELYVSINCSQRHFVRPDLLDTISDGLAKAELPPSALKVEITETALMTDTDSAQQMFRELADRGIQVYLDDFGTGYSSLSYLHRFPINVLKIDRSFVSELQPGGKDVEFIRAIAALAKNLEIEMVAEGIERADQLEVLQQLGCRYGQGYLFSRPIPESDIPALLEAGGLLP